MTWVGVVCYTDDNDCRYMLTHHSREFHSTFYADDFGTWSNGNSNPKHQDFILHFSKHSFLCLLHSLLNWVIPAGVQCLLYSIYIQWTLFKWENAYYLYGTPNLPDMFEICHRSICFAAFVPSNIWLENTTVNTHFTRNSTSTGMRTINATEIFASSFSDNWTCDLARHRCYTLDRFWKYWNISYLSTKRQLSRVVNATNSSSTVQHTKT